MCGVRRRATVQMTVILMEGYRPFCEIIWSRDTKRWDRVCLRKEFKLWKSSSLELIASEEGLHMWARYNFFREINRHGADRLPMEPLSVKASNPI